ncbi:CCA tRNA nucleotidyltransferase [Aquimixticola soesokkakensis]|uniref:CCA tRNA nucleotidyltransferase n=1 Tax=Aquimixticola soesokkakensis TaxID=1519096 RepID=UPI000A27185D
MRIEADWIRDPRSMAVMAALAPAGQAYFVGGCVRNALLGAPVSDIDIATSLVPQTVCQLAQKAGLKVVPTGLDHGTVTVVSEGQPFEVTTFRRDVHTDGRRATVAFCDSLAQDAMRRDFTMNALYADAQGQVIDPLGGLDDLQARIVRFVGDPSGRIREDYLRILRFFRFFAWYGDPQQGVDAEGLAACAAHSAGLETLSSERVTAEIVKLLAAPQPQTALGAMMQSGVLTRVLAGATLEAFFRFCHLSQPDAVARLAALGGDVSQLRLSRAQSKRLHMLRDAAVGTMSAGELGYRLGAAQARVALDLRCALLEIPSLPADRHAVALGAASRFPVKAADLDPVLSGAAIGARLRDLEMAWIKSSFTLTKGQLLA